MYTSERVNSSSDRKLHG